jgi:hypothetical protein
VAAQETIMAKRTTHLCTLPDGKTEKRVSENRVYPFCVAVRLSYEVYAAAALRAGVMLSGGRDHTPANHAFYAERAANPAPHQSAEATAEYRALIAACPTVESYRAKLVADAVARVEAKRAAGGFDAWHVETWCSRRDLAEKAAASLRKPHHAEVRILETVIS